MKCIKKYLDFGGKYTCPDCKATSLFSSCSMNSKGLLRRTFCGVCSHSILGCAIVFTFFFNCHFCSPAGICTLGILLALPLGNHIFPSILAVALSSEIHSRMKKYFSPGVNYLKTCSRKIHFSPWGCELKKSILV